MGSFIFVIYDIVCEALQRKLTHEGCCDGYMTTLTCGGIFEGKKIDEFIKQGVWVKVLYLQ